MFLISTEVLREIRRDIAENLGKGGDARMAEDNGDNVTEVDFKGALKLSSHRRLFLRNFRRGSLRE